MKILVTGAGGVVGTALLPKLSGHEVMTLGRSGHIKCDLENISSDVAKTITTFAPEIFIHAGWAGTENTERNDPRFMQINIDAGMKLMEIAASSGCKHWIGFGSQAEYSSDAASPIAEDAAPTPESNYGKAKLALKNQQQALAGAQVTFTWLRLFACYGKNYKPSYVIPYLIDTLKKGELPDIRTPHAVWDYLHAEDAAEGILRVIEKRAGGVYNLASGKGVSVAKMALILANIMGSAKKEELAAMFDANTTPATHRVADVKKFSREFAWQPRITIEEGLKRCLSY